MTAVFSNSEFMKVHVIHLVIIEIDLAANVTCLWGICIVCFKRLFINIRHS